MLVSNQRPLPCESPQVYSSPSYCVRKLPVLQVFYETRRSSLSTAYVSVPARLQYGCSNFPVSKSVSKHHILTWFLRVLWHHCRSRYSRAAARNCLPSLIVCSASSSLTVSGVAE